MTKKTSTLGGFNKLAPRIQYTEKELIELLKQRDQRAFNYLYDNYSAALYGVIFRIVGEADESADILQESFIRIWRSVDAYHPEKGRLFTWILTIARNMAIDFTRSLPAKNNQKTASLAAETPLSTQEQSEHINADHIGLNNIVNTLNPEQKAIIDLAYFQGYTQEEIAKELNIPLGTVKTRARNALIKLKNLFN